MNNKIIIEFGFCVISRIMARVMANYGDNANLYLDNSRYHAQPHPIIINYPKFSKRSNHAYKATKSYRTCKNHGENKRLRSIGLIMQ